MIPEVMSHLSQFESETTFGDDAPEKREREAENEMIARIVLSQTECAGAVQSIPKKIYKVSVLIYPVFRLPAKIGDERNM